MQHVKLLLLSITISTLFFYLIDVVSWFYFMVLLLIELIIWSNYKTNTNFMFYIKFCIVCLGSLGGYVLARFAQGHNLNNVSAIEITLLGICILLLFGLTLRNYILFKKEDGHSTDEKTIEIFQCRLDDYTRVYHLHKFSELYHKPNLWIPLPLSSRLAFHHQTVSLKEF